MNEWDWEGCGPAVLMFFIVVLLGLGVVGTLEYYDEYNVRSRQAAQVEELRAEIRGWRADCLRRTVEVEEAERVLARLRKRDPFLPARALPERRHLEEAQRHLDLARRGLLHKTGPIGFLVGTPLYDLILDGEVTPLDPVHGALLEEGSSVGRRLRFIELGILLHPVEDFLY